MSPGQSGMSEGTNHILHALCAGLAGLAMCAGMAAPAGAATVNGKRAAFVVDANTGAVLHAQDARELRYPASLTKMMTLYLLFEHIENNRLSYNTRIRASRRAVGQPPSKIGLKVGDQITVRQAVKALVTKSANDVATAVAEHLGGSEANFARMMTRKARELGMRQTVFRNASGLPNRGQVTTARDMAQLALRLRDHFPQHFRHFRTRSFKYGKRVYRNHNVLLGRYRGVDGIKTGYTRASGFNLVTSLKKDGRHVVAVVMGGRTGRKRNAKMRRLLTSYFPQASTSRTRKQNVRVARRAPKRSSKPKLAHATRQAAPRPAPTTRRPDAVTPRGPAIKVAKVRRVAFGNKAPTSRQVARGQPAPRFATASVGRSTVPKLTAAPRIVGEYRARTRGQRQVAPAPRQARQQFRPASGPGRAPGTLDSQAERLATRPPVHRAAYRAAPQDRRQPVASRPAATANGAYHVQVGAYASAEEAQRQLERVASKVGLVLSGARPLAMKVASGNRHLYRARYAGFDAGRARSACNAMRQHRIDCFVARAN